MGLRGYGHGAAELSNAFANSNEAETLVERVLRIEPHAVILNSHTDDI